MKYLYLTSLAVLISFASFALGPITGKDSVCMSSTVTLSNATVGGTWSSSNPAIASIGSVSGLVTGGAVVTTSSCIITYSQGGSSVTTTVTVSPFPSLIAGPASVCTGNNIALTDFTLGGTWSISNTTVATFNPLTGILYGVAPGFELVTYSLPIGCSETSSISVNPGPNVFSLAGSGGAYCAGGSGVPFNLSGSSIGIRYQLYLGATPVGGPVYGTGSGISFGTIATAGSSYVAVATDTASGCTAQMTGSPSVIVNPAPMQFDIVGGGFVSGGTGVGIGLNGSQTGVIYQLYNGTTATGSPISGTGTSINFGTTTTPGSFIVIGTNATTSCFDTMVGIATVSTCAALSGILGDTSVCPGSGIQIQNLTYGGAWSHSNPSVATLSTSSVPNGSADLFGIIPGIDTVYYTISGCSTKRIITVATVTLSPIIGPTTVCRGITQFSDAIAGGVWSSMVSAIAYTTTPPGSLMVWGAGPTIVYYTLGAQCAALSITAVSAGSIIGSPTMCVSTTMPVSDYITGGTWSSSNPAIASIDSISGFVSGIMTGTTTLTYSVSSGCIASQSVAVLSPPTSISGPASLCQGFSIILSDDATGGTWSSSNPLVASVNFSVGFVIGSAPGVAVISYTTGSSCSSTFSVTVNPLMPITGNGLICSSNTSILADAVSGGAWTSSTSSVATVTPTTGTVYGVTAGISTIKYTLPSGCSDSATIIVSSPPTVSVSTSTGSMICAGTPVVFSVTITGATAPYYQWLINSSTVPGATSPTYSLTPAPADSISVITTVLSTCSGTGAAIPAYAPLTVTAYPTISASATSGCGAAYTLTASGGTTYSWAPATGLSCSSCAVTNAIPAAATTYVVTGSTMGCAGTASVTVAANRIYGYISYAGGTATDSFLVWLIQYDPATSIITATDSVVTCMDGGTPYYQFTNPPAGAYMTKAKMFGTVPGTSGYIPTYSLSSANWSSGATVNHTSAADSMHINMILGTVPPGTGFISGNVYSGAGRNTTTDIPVPGMVIYLENATTHVLTYVYTDMNGFYAFNMLAYGDYIIYPEEFGYHTTPSSIITLSAATPNESFIDFKEHTTYGTITPYGITGVKTVSNSSALSIFPNPASSQLTIQWPGQSTGAAKVIISDMLGRQVYNSTLNSDATNGQFVVSVADLVEGIKLLRIK